MSTVQALTASPSPLLSSLGTLPPAPAPAPDAAAPVETAQATIPTLGTSTIGADMRKGADVEAATAPTRQAVQEAAQKIEQFVKSVGRSLDFSVDSSTGHTILRVVNPENGEVVRQLPSEETLRVARAVDYMQSMLVNQRA